MKVTTMTTQMVVTRQFTITEDNPVVGMAYSSPPKKMIVDRGVIKYTWEDGGWKVRDAWSIDLTGDVLKKDGTRSKNVHTRNPEDDYNWKLGFSSREWVAPEGYQWLESIVALLRPGGDLSMTILQDYEVD